MEFKRKKPKGSETRRWVSECKNYCITFRDTYGLKTYFTGVLVEKGDDKWWNFVQGVPPRKAITKLKRAISACDKHKRLWDAFVKLSHSEGRRDTRLATLRFRAPEVFFYIPVWVRQAADPSLIRMLCPEPQPDQSDDSEVSGSTSPSDGPCSETSCSTPPSGPASPAPAEAGITTPPIDAPLKGISSRRRISAKPAPAPAEEPKKRSKRSTTKSSPSSEPNSPAGKSRKPSAKPASASSRKTKRKP